MLTIAYRILNKLRTHSAISFQHMYLWSLFLDSHPTMRCLSIGVYLSHARLLAIMKDLRYPEDAVQIIGNIYSHSNTTFSGEYFGKTKEIPIQRGTIQGDTLSPYLFIIFLEPLLRWLKQGNYGYTFGTSKSQLVR